VLTDLRYALRSLASNPGFAAAAVLTLALGIGANTAMFSVVHELLLRPLPYRDPARLVRIWETFQGRRNVVAPANYYDWRARSRSFERMAAFVPGAANLSGLGDASRIAIAGVTHDFFDVLAVPPLVGRLFVESDDVEGAAAVAVVGESFWRRELGQDPAAIGRPIVLDGRAYEVVGVAPGWVEQPTRQTEVWLPLATPQAQRITRGAHYAQVVARLRPEVTLERANEELRAIAGALRREHPQTNARVDATAFPLHDELVRGTRQPVVLLFGATGFVLLIACGNVAHLLLARGSSRRGELAVRAALGASRSRLARQLVTESLLLSALGALPGVLLAMWLVVAMRLVLPEPLAGLREAALSAPVLVFTAAAAAVTALIFGGLPALRLSAVPLDEVLRASRSAARRPPAGRFLIALQVALAMVLIAGAALLLATLAALRAVEPGFVAEHRVAARIVRSGAREDSDGRRRFFAELIERIARHPGVVSAAAATSLPLRPQAGNMSFTVDAGSPVQIDGVVVQEISPDYLRTMGVTLVRGRHLAAGEEAAAAIALVSREFARRAWGEADPIGRRFRMGPTWIDEGHPWQTVVGLVEDVRQHSLAAPARPQIYLPYGATRIWSPTEIVVRGEADPAAIAGAIRTAVREIDPDQPVTDVRTLDEVLSASIAQPRFTAVLIAIFAGLALVLALVGIYGVLSCSVARRTREIGIRMALGAGPGDMLRLIAAEGVAAVLAGLVAGLGAAALLTRFLEGILYGVEPLDAGLLASSALVILVTSAAACLVPTRRAARLDPAAALRDV
jgi:putative ABC transport system permease protein